MVTRLERVRDAALALLPPGRAFSRRTDSLIGRVLEGLAAEFARILDELAALDRNLLPTDALEYLPDWESALGIELTLSNAPAVPALRSQGWIRVPGFIRTNAALHGQPGENALYISDPVRGVVPLSVLFTPVNVEAEGFVYLEVTMNDLAHVGSWTNFPAGTPVLLSDWAYAQGLDLAPGGEVIGSAVEFTNVRAGGNFYNEYTVADSATPSGPGLVGGSDAQAQSLVAPSLEARRADVVARLRGQQTNSAAWEAAANRHGFTIDDGFGGKERWFPPFRAGVSRIGDRVFSLEWANAVRVPLTPHNELASGESLQRLHAFLRERMQRAHTYLLLADNMQLEPAPDVGVGLDPRTIRAYVGALILTVLTDDFTGIGAGATWSGDGGNGPLSYRNVYEIPAATAGEQLEVWLALVTPNVAPPFDVLTMTCSVGDPNATAFQASYDHTLEVVVSFTEQIIVPEWDE